MDFLSHSVAPICLLSSAMMSISTPTFAAPSTPTLAVQPKVAVEIEVFDLADVTLLDGPFKRAMQRYRAYMMQLEPDRFLHNFRKNVGLEPKAPIYGGWESMGVAGQTLGHYLLACALHVRATGDVQLI